MARPPRTAGQPHGHAARHTSGAHPRRARRTRRAALSRRARGTRAGSSSATRRRCRELGIPITVETADGFGSSRATASTPRSTTCRTSALSDAELAALHVAVTAVRLEGGEGRSGLAQARWARRRGHRRGRSPSWRSTPALARLFDAVTPPARRSPSPTGASRGASSRTASCSAGATGTSSGHDLRPRTRPGRSGSTGSRASPRSAQPAAFEPPPEARCRRVPPRRPPCVRRGPPARRRGVLVDAARAELGGRAARRGSGRTSAEPTARSSSSSRS